MLRPLSRVPFRYMYSSCQSEPQIVQTLQVRGNSTKASFFGPSPRPGPPQWSLPGAPGPSETQPGLPGQSGPEGLVPFTCTSTTFSFCIAPYMSASENSHSPACQRGTNAGTTRFTCRHFAGNGGYAACSAGSTPPAGPN